MGQNENQKQRKRGVNNMQDNRMQCPTCHQEMERGFVQSGNVMSWTKRIHKVSLLPRDGEVLLWQNWLKPSAIPASICKDCKTIMMDYSETEASEK